MLAWVMYVDETDLAQSFIYQVLASGHSSKVKSCFSYFLEWSLEKLFLTKYRDWLCKTSCEMESWQHVKKEQLAWPFQFIYF